MKLGYAALLIAALLTVGESFYPRDIYIHPLGPMITDLTMLRPNDPQVKKLFEDGLEKYRNSKEFDPKLLPVGGIKDVFVETMQSHPGRWYHKICYVNLKNEECTMYIYTTINMAGAIFRTSNVLCPKLKNQTKQPPTKMPK